ncbi:hypothetical protein AOLI_G00102110 [Acnodon oligacanthus]
MDEVDTPTVHPLAGNESHEDADGEVEAEDRNTLTDTQLDDTTATFSQTLGNPNSTNFISSGEEACFEICTCHGAPISDLSMVPDEDEVLMPPHELFESEKLSTWPELSDCKALHKLTSKGKKSNMKCEYIEAEASLHEKDADIDQLLENERLEKAAAEAEAQAIQDLMNIHLDEAEDKEENHLAADETTEAFLTEAEVEAVKTVMLQYIDQREAELLGCEVISFADTEPEAPTVTTQTFMDEVDTPTVHPLAGNESHEDADVEVEAEDRNTLMDTQLDHTKATFSQTLGNPNSTNFISSGEEACFEIYTCHGAPISDLSMVPDEDEVLMPPHELFESEKLSTWPELSD